MDQHIECPQDKCVALEGCFYECGGRTDRDRRPGSTWVAGRDGQLEPIDFDETCAGYMTVVVVVGRLAWYRYDGVWFVAASRLG